MDEFIPIGGQGVGIVRSPPCTVATNAFSDDVKDSQDASMDSHVSKPIDLKVLADMLCRIFSDQLLISKLTCQQRTPL